MSKTALVALTMMVAASACAPGRDEAACLAFRPIRPTLEDLGRISGGLAAQILAHDETGRRLCGWQP